jgi:hypothetical protein
MIAGPRPVSLAAREKMTPEEAMRNRCRHFRS